MDKLQEVFFWVSYGSIDVYSAETEEDMKNLFDDIVESIDLWGMEKQIVKAKMVGEQKSWRAAVIQIMNNIDIGSHEQFEDGTGFDIVAKVS